MVPDFIGIGAQKAGSTWLDRNLESHPEIWMPPRKEIHYFDRPLDYQEAPNKKSRSNSDPAFKQVSLRSFRERLWTRNFYRVPRSDEWYKSLFKPGRGQISGEITPSYSTLDSSDVARVRSLMPDAKIIFVMRNPIERLWSHALMEFKREKRDAEDCSTEDLREFAGRPPVRLRSNFLRTLETWGEFFPPESIFVGFLEDIEDNPRPFLRSVYEFLGVDPSFKPPTPKKRVNVRSTGSMPADAARAFAGLYRDDLSSLAGIFGGYPDFWLHCAESLLAGEPREERVPVPMGNSEFRGSWNGSSEFMSGSLASFPDWLAARP